MSVFFFGQAHPGLSEATLLSECGGVKKNEFQKTHPTVSMIKATARASQAAGSMSAELPLFAVRQSVLRGGRDRPPPPGVRGTAHTLTPNLLLVSSEPPVGPRRVARQQYPVATAAAHAGTGALLREEQDQFLQREYFALLISEAACRCHRCYH